MQHNHIFEQTALLTNKLWLRKLVFVTLLSVGLFTAIQQISFDDVLVIETVQIEGEFRYLDKQNLQNSALPHVSGGFFSVNLDRIRNHLLELPWVEDVSIRRQWPHSLRIRVIEKQPVAFWGEKEILSARGNLFRPESIDQSLQLPVLTGPEGQYGNMLKELSRMQAWLVDTGLVIKHISQDERRSWTLTMASGLELRLGRHKQHERLHRFVDVYTEKLMHKQQKIKHIDMRYTNGLAVAWKKPQKDLGA